MSGSMSSEEEAAATSKPLYTVEPLRTLVPSVDLLSDPEHVVEVLNLPQAVDHREWAEGNPTLGHYSRSSAWLSARFHSLFPDEQGFLALVKETFRFSYGIDVFMYFLELKRSEPRAFQEAMALLTTAWNRYEGGEKYYTIIMELVLALQDQYPALGEKVKPLPVRAFEKGLMGDAAWEEFSVKRARLTAYLYGIRSIELGEYLNALGKAMREAGAEKVCSTLGDLAVACALERSETQPLLEPGVLWDLPHLITFVFLVMEYNVEWAISVMEWDRVNLES